MSTTEIHVVTGATGRTGFPLCLELLHRGKSVRALCRKPGNITKMLTEHGAEVVYGDVCRPDTLDTAFSGADCVHHLAGVISIGTNAPDNIRSVNVGGTQNVIDACLKQKVKRLIYVGTCHTLPFTDKKHPLFEPEVYQPDMMHDEYSRTKAEASRLVLEAVRERGLDAVIALPTGIIGPYEYTHSNFGEMVAMVADKRLRIFLKGQYDFVDVRDVCAALCDLADVGVSGESYLVSGHTANIKELMDAVADAAGIKRVWFSVPMWLVKLFARPAELISVWQKKPPTFTPYSMQVLCDNCNFRHDKLTALTGYAPMSVRESLRDHTQFYLTEIKPLLQKEKSEKKAAKKAGKVRQTV